MCCERSGLSLVCYWFSWWFRFGFGELLVLIWVCAAGLVLTVSFEHVLFACLGWFGF